MKSNNYIVIQGWMCNELGLKGNDLLVYALIYGFSQDGESMFHGSRNYIANTFNISKPTVDKAIQNLVDRQYILEYETNGFNEPNNYIVNNEIVKKLYWGSKVSLQGGSKETLLNNIDINKTNNKKSSINTTTNFQFGVSKTKKPNLYQKCVAIIDEWTDLPELRDLLVQYLNFRLEVKDKPLYANMWKGMLKKLEKVQEECHPISFEEIIQQSLERGYLSFYPVKQYKNQKSVFSEYGEVHSDTYTDAELEKQKEWQEQMEKEGKRIAF